MTMPTSLLETVPRPPAVPVPGRPVAHLAFVTTHFYPRMRGGAEHSLLHHAESLVARGYRVSVLSLFDGKHPERIVHRGVECHALPAPNFGACLNPERRAPAVLRALWHVADVYNPAAGRLLERELRALGPDLVQTENLPGWSCAAWDAIRRAGLPHVQLLHDYQLTCPAATRFRAGRNCDATCARCVPFAALPRRLSRRVRHVVANSQHTRDLHRRLGFFPAAESFDVIYGAVPAPEGRTVAAASSSGLRLGYLGRLHPTKGIGALIDAFRAAGRAGAVLRVAGSGDASDERELRRSAEGLAVEFLGPTPAAEFLRTIDVLVVPSLWHEPMGRVVVEAAAHGVPVIASRRGGIPELFDEGETGWGFDPDRPGQLVERIRHISLDDVRRMAPACRRRAAAFAPEPILERWLELYTRLAGRPTREGPR